MKTFVVWITLAETVEAEDADEAFDIALGMIEDREGMEITSHEIIEQIDGGPHAETIL